jgi:hypothetical protein
VIPGTGLHPRPASADDLVQYFPRAASSTGTTAPEPTATTNANTNTNTNTNTDGSSYIDPRWKPTYLVTRKGESVGELYARCEEFLRAFIGRVEGQGQGQGQRPRPFAPPSAPSSSSSVLPANSIATPAAAGGAPSLDAAPSRAGQEYHREGDVGVGVGVGVGHERILLVSHAGTIVALARALTGDEEIERRIRVGCCTLTTLHRSPSPSLSLSSSLQPPIPAGSFSVSPSLPSSLPSSLAARDVIGKGVWTVHGTLADGSFLTGGVERSWGMADIETNEGVVVEDPGIAGSENEEDGPNGVQVWWRAEVPSPKM